MKRMVSSDCLTKIDDPSIRSNNEDGLSMCYAQLAYVLSMHYYIIIYFMSINMVYPLFISFTMLPIRVVHMSFPLDIILSYVN